MSGSVLEAVRSKKAIIVCGSGGVGKTTTSAALALLAAREGRKVIVMTVDPARRLASALGVVLDDNAECRVDAAGILGCEVRGELYAMMLNPKKTFDDLIRRRSPSEDVARTIFANSAYVHGSSALSGSPDYMAMEKFHELYHERNYDLVIIDTPPAKHAIDFVTAPERWHGILEDNPMIKLMVEAMRASGRSGFSLAKLGKGLFFRTAALVTGEHAIRDAAEFFLAFSNLMGGFGERSDQVSRVFRSSECGFFVVTSTNLITVEEALFLVDTLRRMGIDTSGVIVNRTRKDFVGELPEGYLPGRVAELDRVDETLVPELVKQLGAGSELRPVISHLARNLALHQIQLANDRRNVDLVRRRLPSGRFLHWVEELDSDISDLHGLNRVADLLKS